MTIKEKILKIMSLALEINPPEIEDIGTKRTAVFVRWSPHCNLLDVAIYLNGWKFNKNCENDFRVYCYEKEADGDLDAIIARLESIKSEVEEVSE